MLESFRKLEYFTAGTWIEGDKVLQRLTPVPIVLHTTQGNACHACHTMKLCILQALLSQPAAVSLPCLSALQKNIHCPPFLCAYHASPAAPMAPFVAHWLAAVDVGISERCPAWLTECFITWLPCWDNTAGNHRTCRKAWVWLLPFRCCPTQLAKAGQSCLRSDSIHAICSNCV